MAIAIGSMLFLAGPAFGQVGSPQTCYSKIIKSTGGLSVLEGGARGKARSAWIKKVRDSRKLGPSYAVWLRAKDPQYTCKKTGKYHQCEAAAVPCKI